MPLTVRIEGLAELQHKLDGDFLLQPEIEAALDTVAKRGQRGGSGLGARMNPIAVEAQDLRRTLITPLAGRRLAGEPFNPRTKGTAWLKKNIGAGGYGAGTLGSVARNALKSAAKKIAARWAS